MLQTLNLAVLPSFACSFHFWYFTVSGHMTLSCKRLTCDPAPFPPNNFFVGGGGPDCRLAKGLFCALGCMLMHLGFTLPYGHIHFLDSKQDAFNQLSS